jgi:hypothetical protein
MRGSREENASILWDGCSLSPVGGLFRDDLHGHVTMPVARLCAAVDPKQEDGQHKARMYH